MGSVLRCPPSARGRGPARHSRCAWVPCSAGALGFARRERCGKAGGSIHSPRFAAAYKPVHSQRASRLCPGSLSASFIVCLFVVRWLFCSLVAQLVCNCPGRFLLLSSCSLAEQSLGDLCAPAPAQKLQAKPPPEERKFLLTDASV